MHICGKRYRYRPEKYTTVKVYSNCRTVTLYVDGKVFEERAGDKVFTFRISLGKETKLEAVAGNVRDEAVLSYTDKPNPAYKLSKKVAGGGNWT